MIAEQLQAARAAHWRQNQRPILTLDDAQSWLEQHPLCLFVPRQGQLPAPAPSFVEACLGSRQATPGADAIELVHGLLTRLIASGTVVPLNLFGSVSEQPDFLAHRDALPSVLSLRADADWKHAPQKSSGHKVSPLVLELWKVLDKEGALTAAAARDALGRELTEAAVLRALCELWQALRISPVFAEDGQPARWEMLRVRHREALTTAGATGQVTAISLLVSMYLQSVYAASSEEIEIFLSPVASRSRVREAVRGLSATRQIHSLSMDAQTYHFLENGLPEFVELPATAVHAEEPSAAPAERDRKNHRMTDAARRPTPRKVQATRVDSAPAPASAPIFRRPKPEVRPAGRPGVPPEGRPQAKPAAGRPAASKEWKGPARPPVRPGAQVRPPWQAAKPPASGSRWTGKAAGASSNSRARPTPGSRPSGARQPFAPARTFSPPGVRAGEPIKRAGDPGTGTRSYARTGPGRPAGPGGGRSGAGRAPGKPGAWTGPAKRETPKPWALPGRRSSPGARPPRAGGRGESTLRPPAPQGERPSRSGSYRAPGVRPGRPAGRPQGPPFPERADRAAAQGSPAIRAQSSFRSKERPRGGGEGVRRTEERGGPPRSAPSSGTSSGAGPGRFEAAARPFSPRTGPRGGAAPRSGPAGEAGAGGGRRRERAAKPGASEDRPRPGGGAKSGARSNPGRAFGPPSKGGARPPFAGRPGTPVRRGKPFPSAGGRRKDRKKPGV